MCYCIIIVSAASSPYDIRTAYYCQKHWCANTKFQRLHISHAKHDSNFISFFCGVQFFRRFALDYWFNSRPQRSGINACFLWRFFFRAGNLFQTENDGRNLFISMLNPSVRNDFSSNIEIYVKGTQTPLSNAISIFMLFKLLKIPLFIGSNGKGLRKVIRKL